MEVLDKKETINYYGGGKISLGMTAVITGIVVFIMGIFDGMTNPKKCNAGS